MKGSGSTSSRLVALESIVSASSSGGGPPAIAENTWEKLIGIAWDSQSSQIDRREVRRQLRSALLESLKDEV